MFNDPKIQRKNSKRKNEMSIKPITTIDKEGIKAVYYSDHSGYLDVFYNKESIYYADDGLAKHHLKDLDIIIEENEQRLKILKTAQKILKKELSLMPKPTPQD